MSYVKCAVCDNAFRHVNGSHLRKHGLTVAEYRQRYPQAPLKSPDLIKKQSAPLFHRKCGCGQTFETRCFSRRFCQRCSHINNQLNKTRPRKGTFDKNYLEITSNGRVKGAILLEKGISINSSGVFNGSKRLPQTMSWLDEFDYLVNYLVVNGEIYCGESLSPIILARENEHYSIPAEPCCKSCGLVYQLA